MKIKIEALKHKDRFRFAEDSLETVRIVEYIGDSVIKAPAINARTTDKEDTGERLLVGQEVELIKRYWHPPAWFHMYEHMIRNTGGNSIEELMNDDYTSVHSNAIRACIVVSVKNQVALLESLYEIGKL